MQAGRALAGGLKRLRAQSKLSQAALAERAGLSLQFIAALEQRRKEPSLATLDALSKALGVEVAELFVADRRAPRGDFVSEIAELVSSLSGRQREHLLAVVREIHALASHKRHA
jgi:transcriptional regulator with XRE-family HTH domain